MARRGGLAFHHHRRSFSLSLLSSRSTEPWIRIPFRTTNNPSNPHIHHNLLSLSIRNRLLQPTQPQSTSRCRALSPFPPTSSIPIFTIARSYTQQSGTPDHQHHFQPNPPAPLPFLHHPFLHIVIPSSSSTPPTITNPPSHSLPTGLLAHYSPIKQFIRPPPRFSTILAQSVPHGHYAVTIVQTHIDPLDQHHV